MNLQNLQTPARKSADRCNGPKAILLVLTVLLTVFLIPSCGLLRPAMGLGLAKLRFGCLPEGTLVDTAGGPVRIEALKSGDTITGFDGKPVQIAQIHQYREDPSTSRYLTLHFSNGSSVSASPRHRINGIPAADLQVNEKCGSHTVVGIESLNGVSRSFDLLTEDVGYRIGGIPVNSMIAEMSGSRASASSARASR